MKKLPFDPEEIELTEGDSNFFGWLFLILCVGYFVGRVLVTIIWGI